MRRRALWISALLFLVVACGSQIRAEFQECTFGGLGQLEEQGFVCHELEPPPDYSADDPKAATAYWTSMGRPAVLQEERFKTLHQMTESADLVVFARPVGVLEGPSIGIEGEEDDGGPSQYTGVEYEVIEQVKGIPPDRLILMDQIPGTVLSSGPSLFFLRTMPLSEFLAQGVVRSAGEIAFETQIARLINSQSVFIEVDGVALNPMSLATSPDDPILDEIVTLSINDLVHIVHRVVGGEATDTIENPSLSCLPGGPAPPGPTVIQWCAETLIAFPHQFEVEDPEDRLAQLLTEALTRLQSDQQSLHTVADGSQQVVTVALEGTRAIVDLPGAIVGQIGSEGSETYMFEMQMSANLFQFIEVDSFVMTVDGSCDPIDSLMQTSNCHTYTRLAFEADPMTERQPLPEVTSLVG